MSIQNFIILFLTWIPISLILFDSFGNNNKIFQLFGISSATILVIGLIILSLIRIFVSYFSLPTVIRILFYILLFFIGGLTIFLTLWDSISTPNYVYSLTRLHLHRLGELSIFLIGILLLLQSNDRFNKYYKLMIFLQPLLLLLILYIVYQWPFSYFLELVKEDSFVEYMQFFVLLGGAFFIFTRLFRKHAPWKKLSVLFIISSLIFLLAVAGDEISWGQRILGITPPDYIVAGNRQHEITVHNTYGVEWMVDIIFVIIGLVGGLSSFFFKIFRVKKDYKNFIPSVHLCLFFLIPAVYYAHPLYAPERIFGQWSEVMELLLYMGIVLYLVETCSTLLSIKSSKKS